MKHNILVIALASSFALTGCMDQFNELNPNAPTTENSWNTLKDGQKSLNAVYNSLYHHDILSIEPMTLCTDMGFPGYGRNSTPTNAILAAFYHQTYINSSDQVSNRWGALYIGILRANQTIEGLETLLEKGVPQSEAWTHLMAQARFFRGLYHFYLHATFNQGEVIIRDKVPVTDDELYQSVSSSEEVIAFFRKDLEYAYANLPEAWIPKDERVTKGTVATILGTSHLYEEEFEQAITYFEDVIQNKAYGYELVRDMDLLFTTAGEFNKESIFEINYQLGIHPEMSAFDNNAPTNRLGYTSSNTSFTLPCWLADAYQTEKMDPNDPRNWVTIPAHDGSDSLRMRSMPLRGSAMVATIQDDDTPYYLQPQTSLNISVGEKNAVGYYRKYSNWDIIDDEKSLPDGERKSGKNVTVNRLADVYLMYAECMLRGRQDVTTALKYMNLIRERWGVELLGTPELNPEFAADKLFNGISYDAETLFKQLQDYDRPVELAAEGHALRFIDLRRWNYGKARFVRLAQDTYHMAPRLIPGTLKPRNKSWLKFGKNPEGEKYPEITDYTVAAKNYDATRHAYWPIPLSEETDNPALYNK